MSGQTFRENVAQDLAYVFDCAFSSRLIDGKPEGGVWPTWASQLHAQVAEWAVQRFGEEMKP